MGSSEPADAPTCCERRAVLLGARGLWKLHGDLMVLETRGFGAEAWAA